MAEQAHEVVDVPDKRHYAISIEGREAGHAAYRIDGSTITFTHTEVDPDQQGDGIGSALVRGALDDARRRELTVVPQCSFVRAWIDANPDYADLVHGG